MKLSSRKKKVFFGVNTCSVWERTLKYFDCSKYNNTNSGKLDLSYTLICTKESLRDH